MAQGYDLIVVGMGSAGMVAAEFARTLDLRIAVVEQDRVGGDCLWTGCVPSKALLASAKAAHILRTADDYGLGVADRLAGAEAEIDTTQVWKRIRAIQAEIAATDDNPERFEALGIEIIRGTARIVGPTTVEVGDRTLDGRFILVCTGSRPVTPPIEGLGEAGFLTNETIFELERAPRSMIMIGGGPISVEMAQATARLGVATTVLQLGPRLLPRDEPELVALLTQRLRDEGVELYFGVKATRVTVEDGVKVVHGTQQDGQESTWRAEEILVGAGRRPNVKGLGLEEMGVEVGPRGVVVDSRMRTTVASIYAVGDVAGRFLFTHSAGYEGVRAVRDMFFPGRGTVTDLVPWCTFTDPELAHAGLTIAEAKKRYDPDGVEVWRQDLSHSDRARADGAACGAVIVVTAKRRIVGAHILAPAAGEMIHELALAIHQKLKLNALSRFIHVYPTLSIAIGQLAAQAAYDSAVRFGWLVRRKR